MGNDSVTSIGTMTIEFGQLPERRGNLCNFA